MRAPPYCRGSCFHLWGIFLGFQISLSLLRATCETLVSSEEEAPKEAQPENLLCLTALFVGDIQLRASDLLHATCYSSSLVFWFHSFLGLFSLCLRRFLLACHESLFQSILHCFARTRRGTPNQVQTNATMGWSCKRRFYIVTFALREGSLCDVSTLQAGAICVLAGVALLTSVTNFDSRFTVWWQARKAASSTSSSPALKPEEMAILLKTGSGMRQRLEMHLQNEFAPGSPFTSFQVYSDYEHDVMGHHVVDALKDLNASAMQQEEWDLYQQHKADLDSGVSESDLDLKAGQHWFDGGRAGDNYSKSWGIDK